ncbi:uncharacterized protein MELLADRAFT_57258 [Melampsora larici-populina 98AG31]|uniref:Uncharacterized protein n=1 Tax=Melampsora larici-populina (strain 98AG31 / pathotype 3-4-7) TaxID=747676 RepID=F4S061_MELLP|nr:uncharacterized protein MELLADRAFT_57258 [Melampsora larici-populina 98AG31]EGG01905.1 hypothetical protein MELLADRAFT_57258 [Melampsora larici-populina 98AG31]
MLSLNAVQLTSSKLCTAEKTLQEAKYALERLQSGNINYTKDHFASQWEHQKHCQLTAMEDESLQKLEQKLVSLLELEEKLRDAHNQLSSLRKKRRRNQTDTERADLVTLPASIVKIEKAIHSVAEELGNPEFRDIRKATDPKARALINIRLAKMKLYKAKVGIIEAQKKWDRNGQGMFNTHMRRIIIS